MNESSALNVNRFDDTLNRNFDLDIITVIKFYVFEFESCRDILVISKTHLY